MNGLKSGDSASQKLDFTALAEAAAMELRAAGHDVRVDAWGGTDPRPAVLVHIRENPDEMMVRVRHRPTRGSQITGLGVLITRDDAYNAGGDLEKIAQQAGKFLAHTPWDLIAEFCETPYVPYSEIATSKEA